MPNQSRFEPYVGPQPFGRADANRFFGRDDAAEELFSLVVASRVVILYAQSGTGKSSLVNAGLRPLLETDGFDILPTARVQGGLPAGKSALQLGNPYAYFTVVSWGEQPPERAAEGTMSVALARRPRATDRYGDLAYRFAIFDQFEELFTSFPECWTQRKEFAAELAECIAHDERLRILFVVREDHLADMLSLADTFAAGLVSSFRLPLLGNDAAIQAIECPLERSSFRYDDGVAAQLVEDLARVRVETAPGEVVEVAGDAVEPVQLQVVCTELWRSLPLGSTVITAAYLSSLGDATAALARYYDTAVIETAKRTKIDPIFLRRWVGAQLITPAKTRGTAYRGVRLTAGLPNPAVDALENRHLIRAETRAGARWYELTHDRFIQPIERANVRAFRWGRLRYWGAVLPVAAVVIGVARQHQWPHGGQDVLARIALALIASAGIFQVSWTAIRRRLGHWQPWERQPKGARLAALGGKWWYLIVVAILLFFSWVAFQDLAREDTSNVNCNGRAALTVLYKHAAPPGSDISLVGSCLHGSSNQVNWGLGFGAVALAGATTAGWSRLSRRLVVRRWRRRAVRQAGAETAKLESGRAIVACGTPHDRHVDPNEGGTGAKDASPASHQPSSAT